MSGQAAGARRWVAAAAVLTAAGMAVAGCGSSSSSAAGSNSGSNSGSGSGSKSAAAKTVTIKADMVEDGDPATMTGVEDFSGTLRADVTMKPISSSDPSAPSQMRVVVNGGTRYLSADSFQKSGGKVGQAIGDKKWVRMESGPSSPASQQTAAAAFGAVALETEVDLTQAVTALLQSGLVKADGAAGHYAGTVSADVLDGSKLDAAHRTALATALKDEAVTSEKIELWIGGDGLPTEIKFSDEVKQGKKASKGDIHFSGWGQPVTVKVPADGDAIAYDALTKAVQAG